MSGWVRAILHADMDAFFAAVEELDDPSLRGRPVVVGGAGRRGVVATANYVARRYGVRSAMPGHEARRRCPEAVFVPARMERYAEVSALVMEVFSRFSPLVQPLSLDEAFVDLTGTERLFGPSDVVARRIAREVQEATGLTCSVGLGTSRLVAKIASDLQKPAGLVVVPPGSEPGFLAPLEVGRIPGVGPQAQARLAEVGIRRIGQLLTADRGSLERAVGRQAEGLLRMALGIDERPVVADRERSSLGAERTFEHDIRGEREVERRLWPLAQEVARGLRARSSRAGGVRLKLKYADFRQVTRERRLPEGLCDAASLLAAALELARGVELEQPIRLVGLTAIALRDESEAGTQAPLLDLGRGPDRARSERLERALDAIEARFGGAVVARGAASAAGRNPYGSADEE